MSHNFFVDIKTPVLRNEPLNKKNWLGVGGVAEFYAEPADLKSLQELIVYAHKHHIPVTMLGAGSNVLIRDGGVDGLVLHLGKNFDQISIKKDMLICGAGALLSNISKKAAANNISGFEFMCGIPGTLGGGLVTNAGAYGSDLSHVVAKIYALDKMGKEHVVDTNIPEMFGYRECKIPTDWIFTQVVLVGKKEENNQHILHTMATYKEKRVATQPQKVRTAGSTFRNPENQSAWQLLDKFGFRGKTLNGACFSEKHPNFLVNLGKATSNDLEKLIKQAQQTVLSETGITLMCEIKILGKEKR